MIRFGFGYDIHRFAENRRLVLGGVDIPFEKGLLGHSDADVLVHAIADALLGAAALGDIGVHFPDNDQQYRGISSLIFLKRVKELLDNSSFKIVNIDSTIVLQKPKIASYIPEMCQQIAGSLQLAVNQVSVKATTNEGLGSLGACEGCVAYAVASLMNVS